MMSQKIKNLKNNKGFTLVELIITMGIIGVLTAIALPQFGEYKQRGYDTNAKAELHHLYGTCKVYWGDTLSANTCSMALATQASYGFISSTEVVMSINVGTEEAFEAQASHSASSHTYTIDSAGNISLQ